MTVIPNARRVPIGGASSYVATHFVAPFVSVAGASSDEQDMGSTAWTNAASISTPTTLGTAMARAVAGNKVQCAGGAYLGTATNENWNPCWHPVNSGTSGNPIVIFAAVPAATNPTSGSLSKLSNGSTTDGAGAVYGSLGFAGGASNHDVIWDGFWVDQQDGGFPAPSNGQAVLSGECVRISIRRGLFDRTTIGGGDNRAAIFAQQTVDCVISDCLFRGGTDTPNASHNNAAVSWYGNENLILEYCTTAVNPNDSNRPVGCATFVKAVQSGRGNSGQIRFCRFLGLSSSGSGIEVNGLEAAEGGVEIYQNIVQGGYIAFGIDNSTDLSKTMNVHHNTFVDTTGGGDPPGVVVCDPVTNDDEVTFKNNIVVHLLDMSLDHVIVITVGFDLNQCVEWNYNCYFHAGASAKFQDDSTPYTTLASWQALWTPAEANSIYSNPEFVNYAAGDFHLANNGQPALTASSTGGPVGAYITGSEEIGVRANPMY